MVPLKFKKLHPDAVLPSYETAGAAGMDVRACIQGLYAVGSRDRMVIPTGLAVEVPEGYELQCRPRSGLAHKWGLSIVNSPGTIDSDYRGEIKINLVNLGQQAVYIDPGDRIAQLVLAISPRAIVTEVDELSSTDRGAGGFGSTGSK